LIVKTAQRSRGIKSLVWSGLAVTLPFCAAAALHEEARITVGDLVAVSSDRRDVPHVEPCLAAHPADPGLLFGAAVTFPEANPKEGLAASIVAGFRSSDGGRTWAQVPFPECRIDPWVSFGKDHQVYLSCLGRHNSLLVYHSADAGRTWGAPARVPAGHGGDDADRPVLSVGRPAEPRGGAVYVTFGQSSPAPGLRKPSYGPSVARSIDGGRTFSQPVFLKHDNLTQQPFDAVVLSSGALVAFFMDYSTPQEAPLPHRRTWMAKSRDGGQTFSIPALVHAQLGDEMPWSVAADRSTRRRDWIYLAVDGSWRRAASGPEENRAAAGGGLLLRVSEDGGESWRAPVSVTDAPPGANAELPAIAVNGDGVVGVAWSDTRRDPKGECFDIYFTASLDGGATFLPNVRVTPELSCPKASAKQRGVAVRWPFGGDFSGLAAGADGRFHLFWVDSRTGIYQVWTTTAQVTPQP
jgi:hypothetical protein